jgi:hypothetical protein
VYADFDCTYNLTTVDWGVCYRGETKTVVAYLKNVGNTTISLTIQTSNWLPSNALQYISFTHDYSGQDVTPDTMIPVTFNLTLSPDISQIDTFSFDILLISQG